MKIPNKISNTIEEDRPYAEKAGYGVVDDSRIIVEYSITNCRISKSGASNPLKTDYIIY